MSPALPARVLLIEDEAMLRSSMVRGLARVSGIEVVQAGTLGEGLALLDQGAPALIVSDIDLPDRSGLELIGEVGRRGFTTPIVFISAYLRAFRAQIPPHANVEVLEKPVGIEELRNVVQRYVSAPTPPATAPFGVADYMQLASLGLHSVVIEVQGKGRITVHEGQVWSAADEHGEGIRALQRLLFGAGESVVCQAVSGEPGPRTLQGSAEEVLLEAARRIDEDSGLRGPGEASSEFTELELEPSLQSVPGLAPSPPPAPPPKGPPSDADRFDALCEAGLEATFAKRYQDALTTYEEARTLRPDDRRVEANIVRLKDILSRVAPH